MNIDIDQRDVIVGFDGDGRPLNFWGEIVPHQKGKKLCMSKELLESIRRARKEIEE